MYIHVWIYRAMALLSDENDGSTTTRSHTCTGTKYFIQDDSLLRQGVETRSLRFHHRIWDMDGLAIAMAMGMVMMPQPQRWSWLHHGHGHEMASACTRQIHGGVCSLCQIGCNRQLGKHSMCNKPYTKAALCLLQDALEQSYVPSVLQKDNSVVPA